MTGGPSVAVVLAGEAGVRAGAVDAWLPDGAARQVVDEASAVVGRDVATWWRDPSAADLVSGFGETASVRDALAYLGYDALDWRPVLRQIRTRLIGEMSGYGGPNITTRAGTRKV